MKNGLLAALLTSALVSAAGAATVPMSPPSAQPKVQTQAQPKVIGAPAKPSLPVQAKAPAQARADCPCNCPQKFRRDAGARSSHARRHFAYHAMRRYARTYHYAAAAPVVWRQWGGPMTAPGYEVEGLSIEDRGWTGGVGYNPDGGGGGGFVDGYGQVHFANGGGGENGPSYNSYGQSFQNNPSQAGPFQPRLMGGFAPPNTGSR